MATPDRGSCGLTGYCRLGYPQRHWPTTDVPEDAAPFSLESPCSRNEEYWSIYTPERGPRGGAEWLMIDTGICQLRWRPTELQSKNCNSALLLTLFLGFLGKPPRDELQVLSGIVGRKGTHHHHLRLMTFDHPFLPVEIHDGGGVLSVYPGAVVELEHGTASFQRIPRANQGVCTVFPSSDWAYQGEIVACWNLGLWSPLGHGTTYERPIHASRQGIAKPIS